MYYKKKKDKYYPEIYLDECLYVKTYIYKINIYIYIYIYI